MLDLRELVREQEASLSMCRKKPRGRAAESGGLHVWTGPKIGFPLSTFRGSRVLLVVAPPMAGARKQIPKRALRRPVHGSRRRSEARVERNAAVSPQARS